MMAWFGTFIKYTFYIIAIIIFVRIMYKIELAKEKREEESKK